MNLKDGMKVSIWKSIQRVSLFACLGWIPVGIWLKVCGVSFDWKMLMGLVWLTVIVNLINNWIR